ncbi:MAG: hypothetical protein JWR52_3882 [Marmoricola sp.]|nr:hypothetical protein [Marmoricola sp.]
MKRPNPNIFYTQPTFRADSPDIAKAKGQTDWTLETPGIRLRLAIDYYRFEAFANERDRNARCGPTAHEDVRYAPAKMKDLRHNGISLDDIACGYDIDHPDFERVVSPLFDAAMRRLIGEVVNDPDTTGEELASTEVIIARARYSIVAKSVGEWIKFPISAMAVFEKGDRDVIDRTIAWLENRLELTASPLLFGAPPN